MLTNLVSLLESANGPSREMDDAICRHFGKPYAPYSESLDCALALVEEKLPGWDWSLHCDNGEAIAGIQPPSEEGCDTSDCVAATPALAVLSALLRALIAQKETADGK